MINILKEIIDVFTTSQDNNSNNTIWNIYKNSTDIKIINTEKELINFVNNNRNIRVIGGGMNWNGACFSKHTIRLGSDFLNYKINHKHKSITVGSSCMIFVIHNFLLKNNLQMKSIGYCIFSNKSQTIGGLCCTNVHHTGKLVNPFSETCTSIVVLHFDSCKSAVINTYYPDDDFFKYFFGSIGTLGILLYATFKIEPLNYYKIKETKISNFDTNDIINGLKDDNGMYILNSNSMITYDLLKLTKNEKRDILINPYNENFDNNRITQYKNPILVNRLISKIPINITNIYFKLTKLNYKERIVKSISHISDSNIINCPRIEFEIYIREDDTIKLINFVNENKLYKKFVIIFRYVLKINNSLFTLDNNMITCTFINFNMNKTEMNDLFSFISEHLKKINIQWYPHFGKFIGDNYKFSNFFNLDKYNIIRRKVDPNKIFISKFN